MTRSLTREDMATAKQLLEGFKKVGKTEGVYISEKGDSGTVFDLHDWNMFAKQLTPGNVESLMMVVERELGRK